MTTRLMLQFQRRKPPRQAINLSAILLAFMLSVAHGGVTAGSTTTKKDEDDEPETHCPCSPCGYYPCVPYYYPPPPPRPPLPPPSPLPPAPPYLPPRPYYPPPLYPQWPWPTPNYGVYSPGTYPMDQQYDYSSGARLSYLVWFPAFVAAALLLMWS